MAGEAKVAFDIFSNLRWSEQRWSEQMSFPRLWTRSQELTSDTELHPVRLTPA